MAEDDSQGGWSEPPAPDPTAPPEPLPGDARARYRIGAFVGQGGMGVVHAARDLRLGRDVALKRLAPGRPPATASGLLREAQIAARLDHPGVVAIHDLGALEDGQVFYAMRLVRGRSLGEALARGEAPRALLRHVLAACEAVGAAHAVGLVHRDLKPANVLIGPHGETQVVDWGLAAPTPAAAARWGDLPGPWPQAGGSPGFVAPAQAAGAPPDPRHDVWSLGAILQAVAPRSDAPLQAVIARAQASAGGYPDAGALAAELAAWFEGRRVAALRYGPADWARWAWQAWRRPLQVALVAAALLALAVGLGWWQTARSRDRALAAEAAAMAALRQLQRAEAVRAAALGDRISALALADAVLAAGPDPLAAGVRAAFGRQPGAVRLEDGPAPACRFAGLAPGGRLICQAGGRLRCLEGDALRWEVADAALGGVVRPALGVVQVSDAGYETRLRDLETGALRLRLPPRDGDWLPHNPPRRPAGPAGLLDPEALPPSGCALRIKAVAVSASGEAAALCEDGRLILARPKEATARSQASPLAEEHVGMALAWLPDGRLVAGSLRGRLVRFDATGAAERVLETGLGAIERLVPSPDGRWVAVVGAAAGVGLWQQGPAQLAEVVARDAGPVLDVAFEGGRLVVLAARRQVFALPGDRPRAVQAQAGLAAAAPLADGRLALGGGDGWIHTVDLASGAVTDRRLGPGVVKAVGAGPFGPWASGMFEPPLVSLAPGGAPLAGGRRLRAAEALADGSLVGIDVHAGLFRWVDPARAPQRLTDRAFAAVAATPTGWLTLDRQGAVEAWQPEAAPRLVRTAPGGVALAAAGGRVALADRDGVRWWGRDAGALPADPRAPPALALALDPAGARLAVGDRQGEIRLYALPAGTLIATLPGHTERVVALRFLPDGDLVSVSWDRSARIWAVGPAGGG